MSTRLRYRLLTLDANLHGTLREAIWKLYSKFTLHQKHGQCRPKHGMLWSVEISLAPGQPTYTACPPCSVGMRWRQITQKEADDHIIMFRALHVGWHDENAV